MKAEQNDSPISRLTDNTDPTFENTTST